MRMLFGKLLAFYKSQMDSEADDEKKMFWNLLPVFLEVQ